MLPSARTYLVIFEWLTDWKVPNLDIRTNLRIAATDDYKRMFSTHLFPDINVVFSQRHLEGKLVKNGIACLVSYPNVSPLPAKEHTNTIQWIPASIQRGSQWLPSDDQRLRHSVQRRSEPVRTSWNAALMRNADQI